MYPTQTQVDNFTKKLIETIKADITEMRVYLDDALEEGNEGAAEEYNSELEEKYRELEALGTYYE